MTEPITNAVDVACPSGLVVSIRRLRLREMDMLADRKLQKKGTALDAMLRSVWVGTREPGIYKPPFCDFPVAEEGIVPDWNRVLVGDRTFLLLELRKMSRGPEFEFDVTCAGVSCRRQIQWEIDLSKLEVTGLSDEAKIQLASTGENEFRRELPFSGATVGFKLLTGADERIVGQLASRSPDSFLSASLLARLPYISGASGPGDRESFVKDMDITDAQWLQDQWEEADITIQTAVEIECPHCFKVQTVEMPFDNDFFWKPSSRRRRTSEQ